MSNRLPFVRHFRALFPSPVMPLLHDPHHIVSLIHVFALDSDKQNVQWIPKHDLF